MNAVKFTGISKMKDTEVELYIDENIQTVTQPHRRTPFTLENRLRMNWHDYRN